MKLTINDQEHVVSVTTLSELLTTFNLDLNSVVVLHNETVVSNKFSLRLSEGDTVEIIIIQGGG